MKSLLNSITFILIVVYVSIILPTNAVAQKTKTSLTYDNQNIKSIEFEVGGMTCQKGCADGIDKKLKTISGVLKSKTKLETGISKITYDSTKVTMEKLISIIEERGYTVKLPTKDKKK